MADLVPVEIILSKIFFIRGQKVMLDRDLAKLYGVETRVLNQAVKRNIKRFPDDFMFALMRTEIMDLSQIVISSKIKHAPRVFAFTEQGVAMLSSVLNSDRAVMVNIQIMRTFTQMRKMMLSYKELKEKIEKMEGKYDKQFHIVFQAMKQMLEPPKQKPAGKIGF